MTVCIAAKAAITKDPALVLCMDMMGSTDSYSAEHTWKLHILYQDFHGLVAGPIAIARELAYCCGRELEASGKASGNSTPDILRAVRNGVGRYKKAFAESHTRSRLGISYDEFMEKGKTSLADDIHREICWEIKNHYSQAELIVAGFLPAGFPVIFKVSGDTVFECDDFAVIGSGTSIAEATLFQRSQNMQMPLDVTIYHVYEAKRLAENAPGVGRATELTVHTKGHAPRFVTRVGYKILSERFTNLAARPVDFKALPDELLS